jgi:hypothetical protein
MNGAARLGHVLTVLLIASGCSMVAVTDVSQAVSSPGSPHRMNADGSIDLPGIGVAVVPHNKGELRGLVGVGPIPIVPYWESQSRGRNEFWVSVRLDPEGEDFVFDPRAVSLRLAGGEPLSPSAFAGPNPGSTDRRQGRPWCGDPGRRPTAPIAPIPIAQVACFGVRFDVPPPPPAQPFTVTVSGILRAGQAWPAVTIGFAKGEVWGYGTAP